MPETEAARLIKHHTRRLKTLRKRLKPVSEKTPAPKTDR